VAAVSELVEEVKAKVKWLRVGLAVDLSIFRCLMDDMGDIRQRFALLCSINSSSILNKVM
jgi:hypothetical protein